MYTKLYINIFITHFVYLLCLHCHGILPFVITLLGLVLFIIIITITVALFIKNDYVDAISISKFVRIQYEYCEIDIHMHSNFNTWLIHIESEICKVVLWVYMLVIF